MISLGGSSGKRKKQDLDFDVNLIPAIDLLSVCICFLLLTAVWINLGSLGLKQGTGETNLSAGVNSPSLWIQVNKNGDLRLSTRDLPASERGLHGSLLKSRDGKIDRARLDQALDQIKKQMPSISTVIVRPESKVAYGQVISVIDRLKAAKVKDVGIAPEST
jgi:biopolymer transport protein TolR